MIGEPNSRLREPIERGRFDHRIPIAPQVAPTEVVGENEEDIRSAGISSMQRSQRREQEG
jgi:hypothetical protein